MQPLSLWLHIQGNEHGYSRLGQPDRAPTPQPCFTDLFLLSGAWLSSCSTSQQPQALQRELVTLTGKSKRESEAEIFRQGLMFDHGTKPRRRRDLCSRVHPCPPATYLYLERRKLIKSSVQECPTQPCPEAGKAGGVWATLSFQAAKAKEE